ncbi:MAG TPA: YdeI/OmpD-associated family protein [Polyangia bacterium]|nr:YdeI/OmpD-associated family protein [Polyangia bacterium]
MGAIDDRLRPRRLRGGIRPGPPRPQPDQALTKGIAKPSATEPTLAPKSATAWRAWLEANHARSPGVWLRIIKGGADAAADALTYATALDGALIWGWIDSQKKGIDATAWLQRFTPRRARSPWSKINCARAEALIASGTIETPGLAEIERAKRDGRWARAYQGARVATVPADLAAALARNAKARAFFEALDGANRYAILYRVQAAKKPETRSARVAQFVELCARGETLHPPRRKKT